MTSERAAPHRLHVAAAVGEALGAPPRRRGPAADRPRRRRHGGSAISALALGLVGALVAAGVGIAAGRRPPTASPTARCTSAPASSRPTRPSSRSQRIQAVDTVTGPVQRLFGVTGLHVQTPGGGEDGDVVLDRALGRRRRAPARRARPPGHRHDRPARLRLTPRAPARRRADRAAARRPAAGRRRRLRPAAERHGAVAEGLRLAHDVDTWHEVADGRRRPAGRGRGCCPSSARSSRSPGFEVRARRRPPADPPRASRSGARSRVPLARIDGVQIVESPLRRPFGLVTLRLEVDEPRRARDRRPHALPADARREVGPFLAQVAPELAGPLTTTERPPRRARRRFLTLPRGRSRWPSRRRRSPWSRRPGPPCRSWSRSRSAPASTPTPSPACASTAARRRPRLAPRLPRDARRPPPRLQELALTRTPLQRRAGLARSPSRAARASASATSSARSPCAPSTTPRPRPAGSRPRCTSPAFSVVVSPRPAARPARRRRRPRAPRRCRSPQAIVSPSSASRARQAARISAGGAASAALQRARARTTRTARRRPARAAERPGAVAQLLGQVARRRPPR